MICISPGPFSARRPNYELLQNKVNKLECLLESSKLLNSTLDIKYVLQALLSESIANIKGGDAGAFFCTTKP